MTGMDQMAGRRPKPGRRGIGSPARAGLGLALIAGSAVVAAGGTAEASSSVIIVTSGEDAGEGTLRDALETAAGDGAIRRIAIAPDVGTIATMSPLSFAGSQPLTIDGAGAVINGDSAGGDVLTLDAPAIAVRSLTITDGPDDGLVILGAQRVDLSRVSAADNAAQGVLVDDQGSPMGIDITVAFSIFDNNGIGVCDTDGMRVNETGAGSIVARFIGVTATNNDHDGIELDEKDDGDVAVAMRNSSFTDNGFNDCTEPEIDLEDGFDVDEFGAGDLDIDIANSVFTGNAEEGLDFDEGDDDIPLGDGTFDGPGNLTVSLRNVDASNNGFGAEEDNIDIDEVGDGDYTVTMVNVTSNGAFNDGYDGSEEGVGSLRVTLVNSSFSNSSDGRGVDLGESGDGSHSVTFRNVTVDGNDSDGVRGEEEDAGEMTIAATNSSFVDNDGDSLDLSKEGAPEGTLTLVNTAYPADSLNLDNVALVGG